jgi:hypothetical protein
METCTEEVGLLKKKPCGKPKVAQCATCEQPLCATHAVPQVTPDGKKTGKFMCKAHYESWLRYEQSKAVPAAPKPAAAAPKPAEEAPKKDDGGIDFTPSKK